MEKIIALLEKAGCKQELVQAIGESLEQYKTTVQEQFEADYTAKITKAKKICVEETEAYKRELARRTQIFLETKNAAIESFITRQSALNEAAAVTKLRDVKSILEGIEVNGGQVSVATTAALDNAHRMIKQLKEENDKAVALANRQNAIAEKVLHRSRELVSENAHLKALAGTTTRKPVVEGRTAGRQPGRIDSARRSQQPVTTRPTITESQRRTSPKPQQRNNVRSDGQGFGVDDIAVNMDEHL